uniref:Amidohydrolase n=1 Tax=Fervidicoccus fontis TaxID=683846 RepID=A0A7J3ZJY7_9CREN
MSFSEEVQQVAILFYDYNILGSRGVFKGYIYVEDGKIAEIGVGQPPEDLKRADMFYRGHNRLILPGFSSPLTHLSLYPFRVLVGRAIDFYRAWSAVRKLDERDYASLVSVAVKSLVERGYTSIAFMDSRPLSTARILKEKELSAIALVPVDESVDEPVDKIEEELRVPVKECSIRGEERVFLTRIVGPSGITLGGVVEGKERILSWPDVKMCDRSTFYGIGHNPLFSTRSLLMTCYQTNPNIDLMGALERLTVGGESLILKARRGWLERGEGASFIVVRLDDTAFLGLNESELLWTLALTEYSTPKIETVVVNGVVVVDGGQQLVVEDALIERALDVVARLKAALL